MIIACCICMCMVYVASAQWKGAITGKLPQLAYSSGADRLGSAKAGFIDTGIQVLVVDSVNDLYRLQLSKQREAFIAKTNIKALIDTLPMPMATLESWSVRGGEKLDTVSIGISRPVAYSSWMETGPATIVVELYGVQSNTNWITNLSSAKGIKEVNWKQTENDVVQVTITLHQRQHLGYTIGYRSGRLVLSIKRLPNAIHVKDLVIAIDAGHGGSNTGAKGVNTGLLEKNYTLLFAKELQRLLEHRGVTVIMTRQTDTTIDNKERQLLLQNVQPDLLISFHLNSSGRATARGVSTYYRHVAFRPLTQMVLDELLEIDELPEFGNIGSFNFQLVQPTDFPSCLVEVAFISNAADEQLVRDESFREKVAHKVMKGIAEWLRQLD